MQADAATRLILLPRWAFCNIGWACPPRVRAATAALRARRSFFSIDVLGHRSAHRLKASTR